MVKKFFQKIFYRKPTEFETRCDKLYAEVHDKIAHEKNYGGIGTSIITENADAAVLEVTLFKLKEEGFTISETKHFRNFTQTDILFP